MCYSYRGRSWEHGARGDPGEAGDLSPSLSESAAVSCWAVAKGSELAVMVKQDERTGQPPTVVVVAEDVSVQIC